MCVRKKRSFLDTESLSALEAVAIIVLFFALITWTVSYTHLDVYKRQIVCNRKNGLNHKEERA